MNTIEAYAFNDKSLFDFWPWHEIASGIDDLLRNDQEFMENHWEMMTEFSGVYGTWLKDPNSYLPYMIYQDAREWYIACEVERQYIDKHDDMPPVSVFG